SSKKRMSSSGSQADGVQRILHQLQERSHEGVQKSTANAETSATAPTPKEAPNEAAPEFASELAALMGASVAVERVLERVPLLRAIYELWDYEIQMSSSPVVGRRGGAGSSSSARSTRAVCSVAAYDNL
ncbi:3925_t:CDS:2, partial [Acaulospora colombiana]